jgi:hypothetical protein
VKPGEVQNAVSIIRPHSFLSVVRCARSSVTILAIGALLMTTVIPDVDHHFNFAASPQTVAFACDTHGDAHGNPDESKHHCLLCPSSSQKISTPTQQVHVAALVPFSFTFVFKTFHHSQAVDLHYSGKRSPPQSLSHL